MRQLETMVEVTAAAIQERIARIHDALQYLHDTSSLLCSTPERNPRALHRQPGISDVLSGLHARLPGLARIEYRDVWGFSLTYPLEDRPRHGEALASVDPRPGIRWTQREPDPEHEGTIVSPSITLYLEDMLVGVWSFDIPVNSLIEHGMGTSATGGQLLFLVDGAGNPLSSPGPTLQGLDHETLRTGRATLIDRDGKPRRVVARSIPILGWTLVGSAPEEGVMAELSRSFTQAFDRVRQGDLGHRMSPISEDLQGIVDAYNDMVGELQTTNEVNAEALRELEHSRQTTRAVFDGAPMGLVLVRPDRTIIDVNAEFERLTGLPGASVLRRDLASLAAGEIESRFAADLDAPASRAGEHPVETELRRGDGTLFPARIVLRALDLDGVPFFLAGVEDLTLRRSLQARLQHTQQIQAIGKLAAGVAHDFNNLLTAVVGNAHFLRESVDDDELREMADAVLDAAQLGSALTSQLLAISRREIVQPRAVGVPEVLRESETLLRRLLEQNMALEFEIDDGLPPVWADPSQLLQVVMNLVLNARDALVPDRRTIRVSLGRSPDDPDDLRLSVSDDGVGIAESLHGRVFDAFYTTKSRGTGLGLSTVRDIVEELGGRVSFRSAPGRGTTFFVDLPFLESAVSTAAEPTRPTPEPDDRIVVVVDDEALVRDITVRMLERAGIVARGCDGGVRALAALEELGSRVGLVLTDVVMPGMSGRQLADAVASRHPCVPVLFMSGYTEDAALLRGVEASEVRLLRKPFRPDVLVKAVREGLSRSTRSA